MFVQIRDPTDLQGRAQLVCAGGAGHNSAVGKQPEDLLVSDGASSIFIVLLHVCLSVCLSLIKTLLFLLIFPWYAMELKVSITTITIFKIIVMAAFSSVV